MHMHGPCLLFKSSSTSPHRASECSPWEHEWFSKCPRVTKNNPEALLIAAVLGSISDLSAGLSRVELEHAEGERMSGMKNLLGEDSLWMRRVRSSWLPSPLLTSLVLILQGCSLGEKGKGGFPSLPWENFDLHLFYF